MSFYLSSGSKIISDTPCPHCNKQSTYEQITYKDDYVREKTLVYDEMGAYFPHTVRIYIYKCEFCNHFRIVGVRIKDSYQNLTVFEYPLPGFSKIDRAKINQPVILENLDEGMRCLTANAPKGAIVNFRRALQAAVLILGGEGEDLFSQIDNLYGKEIIRSKTKEIAHKVRAFGNLGAHPYEIKFNESGLESFSELTLDDAVQAAEMLILFLEDAFIFSSKLEGVDKRLNELNT
ncbi:MAG: DUF4145 domain-containing protein [bacterium]|nr:DUF4145 domain-containing protein [bacterium]